MRHGVDGRYFGRNTSHRMAMFRNMANSVIQKELIVTTLPKAKEVSRIVERLITLAKRNTPASRRLAFDRTRDDEVVKKLFNTMVDRYKSRPGGYTRVVKISELRRGDAAQMAVLELVDHPDIDRKKKVKVAAAEAQKAEAEAEAAAGPTDPLKKMRKLFSSKKKDAGGKAGSSGAKPAKKSTTNRKIGSS